MLRRPFPPPSRPLSTPPLTVFFYWVLRSLLGALFRIEVKWVGAPPSRGRYILIANHISRFDPLLLLATFPLRPRIWFLAAAERTITVPWRRAILARAGGVIPIFEHSPGSGRRALRDAERVLKAGGVVGIFPEGRVGREEGRLQPVHPGAATLALRNGTPILPVWIAGARRVYWRCQIQIVVGHPFWPPAGVPPAASTASLTGALNQARALAAPVAAPEHPPGLWLNKLL